MKNPTASGNNPEFATQSKEGRRLRLRYIIVSNVRIAVLSILIFIIVWLALELLFPRLIRAESVTAQATEAVAEEATYPPAKATVLTNEAKGGMVEWTVYPVFNKISAEGCRVQSAEGAGTTSQMASNVVFNFVYGDAVEFYPETVPVKIARILDIFRAPEAARDQLGMKLYDVDALSAQGYKKLLEGFQPMLQTAGANAQGDDEGSGAEPVLAFVTAANAAPWTTISTWGQAKEMVDKFEFIGTPVQWNAGVEDLLRYEAGESDLYTKLNECAEYDTTKLIKRAMFDVIASAEGIKEQNVPDAQRLAEIEAAKIYLAVMYNAYPLESDFKGLKPIPTVSFRSAWDAALTQKTQGIAQE